MGTKAGNVKTHLHIPGQGLLIMLCLQLPSWFGRYPQSYCSEARFFRAADALAFLCHYSGNVHSQYSQCGGGDEQLLLLGKVLL